MAGEGQHTVSLDDAIEACRTTAIDMHTHCAANICVFCWVGSADGSQTRKRVWQGWQ
jgi:hypothetical protein